MLKKYIHTHIYMCMHIPPYTCNPSTCVAEAGRLVVQVQPGLYSKFQANLGYRMRTCSTNKQKILIFYKYIKQGQGKRVMT
jgi:hypothetical protein